MFSTIGFYCSLGLSDLFCSSSAKFREGQLFVISDKSHILSGEGRSGTEI